MQLELLKKLNFSDKQAKIYLELLKLGPSSVRILAKNTGIGRGTVYDSLKDLQEKGLVSYYKKTTKQYFVAEDPEKLQDLIERQTEKLRSVSKKMDDFIPELKSLYNKGGERPVSRYFEKTDIYKILEEILEITENSEEKEYRIYSTEGLREYIYGDFETFSDVRISKGIKVKVIAIGEGGELRGLDERKFLKTNIEESTYILIYPGHTAYISLNAKKEPIGVVIENEGVYQTQKIIFDNLWSSL